MRNKANSRRKTRPELALAKAGDGFATVGGPIVLNKANLSGPADGGHSRPYGTQAACCAKQSQFADGADER